MPITPYAQAHSRSVPVDAEQELRAELASRLATDSKISEIMHVVAAATVGLLIWPAVSHFVAIAWPASIALASLLRTVLRLGTRRSSPAKAMLAIRFGVAVLGFAWGAGILIIGPGLPLQELAFITMVLCGIAAGATIALLADPPSFLVLLVGLLGSQCVAMAVNGQMDSNVTGALLVAVFAAAMASYYRRSHAALIQQIRTTKQLEITTAEAGAARDQAQLMARIIEETPDHVGMATPDGRIRYMNRAGRAMLGIGEHDDIAALTMRDLTPSHLHQTIEGELIPAIVRNHVWNGETRLLRRDGREIPVSLVAIAHRDANNQVDSLSVIARDVSQQEALVQSLQAARDTAVQATAAKSAFLANTSHEIRTPLNGILGMVELLLDTELTPGQRRSAELIASSGDTLLNTINDVLDLSKIEAGQLELERIPFDLHHLVHSTVRLLSSRAAEKQLELVSDVADDVPQRVLGDPHRLRQVLSNLIGNAVKFTHAGSVAVSARLLSDHAGRACVRIGVRDTGIGIAGGQIERIFEPFGQADDSTTREYGGTGLGLPIARKLVGLMGGALSVDSAPKQGSEFFFTAEWDVAPDSVAETQRIRESLSGLRVLIVDDHSASRSVLAGMLRCSGSETGEADSTDAALVALRAAAREGMPFALVFADAQMPDRDGFDLATEIRQDQAIGETRIILLASASRVGDDERCRGLDIPACIQKPVSRLELVEAALAAVRGRGRPALAAPVIARFEAGDTRRGLRVLVVEDNAVNQLVAASLLRKRGHHVEIASNGRDAVDAVRRGPTFDVVLMDIQMPEMDGIAATQEIRAQGHTELPIVALTANVSSGESERYLAAGMNGYLSKPFKPHELFEQVERWVSVATASVETAV